MPESITDKIRRVTAVFADDLDLSDNQRDKLMGYAVAAMEALNSWTNAIDAQAFTTEEKAATANVASSDERSAANVDLASEEL